MIFVFSESLLNKMGNYHSKPSSWYAVGWMPIVDEDKSLRPGSGYDSAGARNMCIHQECWRHFLKRYITDAKDTHIIFYGDGKARKTLHSIGALLGDQQEYFHIGINIFYRESSQHHGRLSRKAFKLVCCRLDAYC